MTGIQPKCWRGDSPGALLRIRPEVAGEDPRIRRIAAIIQRDGHVVAGVPINGDKDGKFGVEARQADWAWSGAAPYAE
jgi:hypothetical protein